MRILFDHNAPRQLRRHLVGHHVDAAGERGWAELGNGALLDRAEEAGYEELDTSVSALVRDYLKSLVEDGTGGPASGSRDAEKEAERRHELMRQVFQDFEARGVGLRMSENLTREELYDRTRARAEAQAAADAEHQDLKP